MDNELEDNSTICGLPSITAIQNKLLVQRLRKRIVQLEKVIFQPQTITIEGCQHLRGVPGQNWKSRILSLFNDTMIPRFYIVKMFTDDVTNDFPSRVTIELITYRVKLYVKCYLIDFLMHQRKNNVHVYITSD